MDQNITLNFSFEEPELPPPPISGMLLELKPGDHPDILRMCRPETVNFLHYQAYTVRGGRGDVNNFMVIGDRGGAEERYFLDIQPSQYPEAQLRNNLINDEKGEKVCFYVKDKFTWGVCAPGCNTLHSQSMRVKTSEDGSLKVTRFTGLSYEGWPSAMDFVEPDGFRRSDMGKDLFGENGLIAQGKVLYFFQYFKTLDKIGRSIADLQNVLCPIWDHRDFPCNNGQPYFPLPYFKGY